MNSLGLTSVLILAALGFAVAQSPTPQTAKEPFTLEISGPAKVPEGVPVELNARLTNNSDKEVSRSAAFFRGVPLGEHFDVRKIVGDTTHTMQPHPVGPPFADFVSGGVLARGESVELHPIIGQLFHLTPGDYSVQISEDIEDASGRQIGLAKSNTIRFAVIPAPFTIEIQAVSTEVKAGAPVPINVRLTNNSTRVLSFGAPPGLEVLDRHYVYACNNAEGHNVWKGLGRTSDYPPLVAVKPGEHFDLQEDVASACNMSEPGTYRINVYRADPENPKWTFKSNEIKVIIRPGNHGR